MYEAHATGVRIFRWETPARSKSISLCHKGNASSRLPFAQLVRHASAVLRTRKSLCQFLNISTIAPDIPDGNVASWTVTVHR